MPVPQDDKLNDLLTIAYPRCEVGETLRGGYCELSGKIVVKGLVLCERHARLLEAQDRTDLLEGIVQLRWRLIYVPDAEALRRRADDPEGEQRGDRGERTP